MYKNILFAIFSVVAIFHQQYIHSGDKKLAALQAELTTKKDEHEKLQSAQLSITCGFVPSLEQALIRKTIETQEEIDRLSVEIRAHQAAEAATPAMMICHHCKSPKPEEELFKCARCQTAIYCGQACQRDAWHGVHKSECRLEEPK